MGVSNVFARIPEDALVFSTEPPLTRYYQSSGRLRRLPCQPPELPVQQSAIFNPAELFKRDIVAGAIALPRPFAAGSVQYRFLSGSFAHWCYS